MTHRHRLICAVIAFFLLTQVLEPSHLFSWITSRQPKRVNKIFCWILTSHRYHQTRLLAVNETWPKRCDKYFFYTDAPVDETLKIPHRTVFANMADGIEWLWPKTKAAMNYTFINYHDDFDWFFKADDDTFVIVENLRILLARFDATKPHYLGFRMKPFIKHGYNSGGAGYALSRPALKLFVEQLLPNETLCPHGESEDLQLAICLEKLGILPENTRDQLDRNTFFPYRPEEHFHGKIPSNGNPKFWYYYNMKTGFEAFSENLITLHHLNPDEIRVMELLIYHVQLPLRQVQ